MQLEDLGVGRPATEEPMKEYLEAGGPNRQRTMPVKGMRLGERLMNSLNCCTVSFRPIPALWSSNSYLTMNWWTPPVRGFAVEADVAPSDLDRATREPYDPF